MNAARSPGTFERFTLWFESRRERIGIPRTVRSVTAPVRRTGAT